MMRNILYVDLKDLRSYFNYVMIFFAIYYLFIMKVWIIRTGTSA